LGGARAPRPPPPLDPPMHFVRCFSRFLQTSVQKPTEDRFFGTDSDILKSNIGRYYRCGKIRIHITSDYSKGQISADNIGRLIYICQPQNYKYPIIFRIMPLTI